MLRQDPQRRHRPAGGVQPAGRGAETRSASRVRPRTLPHCPGGADPAGPLRHRHEGHGDGPGRAATRSVQGPPAGDRGLPERPDLAPGGRTRTSRTPDALRRAGRSLGGQYEIEDGELRLYGGEPQMLLLKRDVPGDVRIEFECHQEGAYLNDIGCFLSAVRSENRQGDPVERLRVQVRRLRQLAERAHAVRPARSGSEPASPLVPRQAVPRAGRARRARACGWSSTTRRSSTSMDPDPLSGADRTAVGPARLDGGHAVQPDPGLHASARRGRATSSTSPSGTSRRATTRRRWTCSRR